MFTVKTILKRKQVNPPSQNGIYMKIIFLSFFMYSNPSQYFINIYWNLIWSEILFHFSSSHCTPFCVCVCIHKCIQIERHTTLNGLLMFLRNALYLLTIVEIMFLFFSTIRPFKDWIFFSSSIFFLGIAKWLENCAECKHNWGSYCFYLTLKIKKGKEYKKKESSKRK